MSYLEAYWRFLGHTGSVGKKIYTFAVATCSLCNCAWQGKRIVAFVVGGVTRSEMRVAHKLSAKLGREILIGSTSCDTPTSFLKSLQVQGHPQHDPSAHQESPCSQMPLLGANISQQKKTRKV